MGQIELADAVRTLASRASIDKEARRTYEASRMGKAYPNSLNALVAAQDALFAEARQRLGLCGYPHRPRNSEEQQVREALDALGVAVRSLIGFRA